PQLCTVSQAKGRELAGNDSMVSTTHYEALNQGLGQMRGAHADLHFGNFIRNAPEFDDRVLQIGDSKARAGISVARLTDGSGIQDVSSLFFQAQGRKRLRRARMDVQDFEMRVVVLVGKATLMVRVAEERYAG